MFRLKTVLILLLAVSIVMAGFPVQARPQCPMAKMMEANMASMQDEHKDCDGCPIMAQEKQQGPTKSGCCDDAACNAQCSLSGGMSMSFAPRADMPQLTRLSQRLYATDMALASHLLNTQDRPPKSLS